MRSPTRCQPRFGLRVARGRRFGSLLGVGRWLRALGLGGCPIFRLPLGNSLCQQFVGHLPPLELAAVPLLARAAVDVIGQQVVALGQKDDPALVGPIGQQPPQFLVPPGDRRS